MVGTGLGVPRIQDWGIPDTGLEDPRHMAGEWKALTTSKY